MIKIDIRSRTPIFEQIKEQFLNQINSGQLKPHDKLPSIRQLASDLDLNANTIKRALSRLEEEQVIYTIPGKGVFVSEGAAGNKIVIENAEEKLRNIIISSKSKGVPLERIIEISREIYKAGDKND